MDRYDYSMTTRGVDDHSDLSMMDGRLDDIDDTDEDAEYMDDLTRRYSAIGHLLAAAMLRETVRMLVCISKEDVRDGLILLYRFAGLSFVEIAGELKITKQAVSVRARKLARRHKILSVVLYGTNRLDVYSTLMPEHSGDDMNTALAGMLDEAKRRMAADEANGM